jgi:3-oxoacyl-[acyl-carrier-protein] synthase II
VTGIGVVSPVGGDKNSTMDRLCAGERGQRAVTLFDVSDCRSSIAAEIDVRIEDVVPRSGHWSRTDAMALCAAHEALREARVSPADGIDLVVGGTTAGMFETEELVAQLHRDPTARAPSPRMTMHPLSATADRLCEALGSFGRTATLCSACSSGANAIMLAATWLCLGKSQRVLAGGADGLCRLTYTGFSCLGALSPEPCRPFDERRDGLNLGEGAAFLLLETEASARARGAAPIAELLGWAGASEAHHITNPEPTGRSAATVMRRALARAGVLAEQIGYVNAHGTATRLNDAMESAALHECFGTRAYQLAVSSTKGAMGHTLGAAGAIEAAITAMAIARQELPPTVGLARIDRDCLLGHVLDGRTAAIDAAMSSSFGFGGSDTALVLALPERFDAPAGTSLRRVVVSSAATVGVLGLRGARGSVDYVERRGEDEESRCAVDPKDHLDVDRARRLDRVGKTCAVAIQHALAEAPGRDDAAIGAIVGSAFGNVDDCAAFVDRFLEKGARFASPAVFPSLLPSSPAAHASIYLGLSGPVLSVHDLGTTGEAAIAIAADLIAAGEVDRMAAGGVELKSPLTEATLAPLFGQGTRDRGEGTAVLLLEDAGSTDALAEIIWWCSWRKPHERAALAGVPAPIDERRAWLVSGRPIDAAVELGAWRAASVRTVIERAGDHQAAGTFAAAAAVGAIANGVIGEALVVGGGADRGVAMLFRAPRR